MNHASFTSRVPRRNFLCKTALAAAALACSGNAFAGLRLDSTSRPTKLAMSFISRYSRCILRVATGSSSDRIRLVAEISDVGQFTEALFCARSAGITDLRFSGQVATFRADGQLFEVENLIREDFASKRSGLIA